MLYVRRPGGGLVRTSSDHKSALVLGSLVMLALAPQARAQDWSGFYFGANLGGTWGQSDATGVTSCPANGYFCAGAVTAENAAPVSAAATGAQSGSGLIGGAQAGYNAQTGSFVYGFEMDLSALDLGVNRQGSGNYPTPPPGPLVGSSFRASSAVSTDWLFTARGRFGWAVSNVLLYATGGLAVTDLQASAAFLDNVTNAGVGAGAMGYGENTQTKFGYVVGGGAEWMLTGNWTVRGEYLYVDFGSVTANGTIVNPVIPSFSNPISITQDLSEHIARAAVSYRFQSLY